MRNAAVIGAQSEPQFAALVDALSADPARHEQLTDLLREDHPIYHQRGIATIARMRGWVLLGMARAGMSEAALIFVLEELDTGVDGYLVAAAARALRSYPRPTETLAPFVMRALTNIRYRDEPVSFEAYGEYAVSSTGTSPVRELLATLTWLGPHARGVIAIAAGVCAGLGLGTNTMAALVTRGLAEMTRLAVALGGRRETLAGLAGVGDLILTSTGALSRNRSVGIELGKGRPLGEILGGTRMIAEGVGTTGATLELARRAGIEMPITEQVHAVLTAGTVTRDAIRELMERRLRQE